MPKLFVKITTVDKGRSLSYEEEVDLDEEHEMWDEWTTNGANPELEAMTFEEFHAPLSVTSLNAISELNGRHFMFGYLESLWQSDNCPSFLREPHEERKYEVYWRE